MADDVLIYSLSEHRDLILSLIEASGARRVVEIGSEAGGMTREMCSWADSTGGSFASIEPFPVAEVRALASSCAGFSLVEGRSPEALSAVAPADVYLVDGDHNYWTVSRELEAIYSSGERAPLAVLHDVGWPCARRDQYYSVEALPAAAVHPHSYSRGRAPGSSALVDRGFGGRGEFAVALEEGGPRNGVLTAVEDFLASHADLEFAQVPAVFGLGVIWSRSADYAVAVADLLRPLAGNPLLERLEDNRLRLYMRVLELQDRLGRADPATNLVLLRYAERLADLEAENASLRLERGQLRATLDATAVVK